MPGGAHAAQVYRGDAEGQRLARTRWRLAADIAASQTSLDRGGLDGERFGNAAFAKCRNDLVRDTEFGECGGSLFSRHAGSVGAVSETGAAQAGLRVGFAGLLHVFG